LYELNHWNDDYGWEEEEKFAGDWEVIEDIDES
jgi:hypothetical protein